MLLSFQDVSWNWSNCSSSATCRWGWFPSLASALQSVDFPLWCCQSGWPCTTVSMSTSSGASSYSKMLNNFHVLPSYSTRRFSQNSTATLLGFWHNLQHKLADHWALPSANTASADAWLRPLNDTNLQVMHHPGSPTKLMTQLAVRMTWNHGDERHPELEITLKNIHQESSPCIYIYIYIHKYVHTCK